MSLSEMSDGIEERRGITNDRLADLRSNLKEREYQPTRLDLALLTIELGELLMSALDDLNASVVNLQTQVSAENAELASLVSALQAVQRQLSDLQSQVAAGGAVTGDQLQAVTASIKAVADSAAAAVTAAQTAEPTPAPAGP